MVSFMWTVIVALFLSVTLGALARLLLPGKQKISLGATIFIGFVAAILGGLLAEVFGVADTDGFDWIKFFFQVGFALVGVGFWSGWFFRRT